MSKALVLVVVANRDDARNFCWNLAKDLRENDGISAKWYATTPPIFETPHVEVRFICDEAAADGLLADAIYGPPMCRNRLYSHLKIGLPKTPEVGLHDWIVQYERETRAKELLAKNALNSVYGKDGISAFERLTQAFAKAGAACAVANNPYLKNMLDEYRKENENMSIPPYVMALANHQGPATIYAGGTAIPVKIMDIDSEHSLFKPSETSIRCMVVNEHDIRPGYNTPSAAEIMREIIEDRVVKKKVDRFAIKRVKFGKTSAIYWENGDKTSVVCPEGLYYPEMHMMAMLFDLREQGIAQVIFNNPVTMVRWEDGSKVTVRCQEGDAYSPEAGLSMAKAKHLLGTNHNKSNYYDVFKKWIPEEQTPIANELKAAGISDLRFTGNKMVVMGEDAGTIAFTASREDAKAIEKLIDAYMEGKGNA